jgi:hypothetical protein
MIRIVRAALAAFLLVPSLAWAQTLVVPRTRLGDNLEAMTLVTGGPNRGQLALMDGYDVRALRIGGEGDEDEDRRAPGGARKLFDTRVLGFAPRGIAFVEGADKFIFTSPVSQNKQSLFVTDGEGNADLPLAIQYLPTTDLSRLVYLEGDVWLPHTSAHFPDHLAFLSLADAVAVQIARIDFASHQAVVEATVMLPPPLDGIALGIGFRAPDKLLISGLDQIWECGFNGVCAQKATVAGAIDVESVVGLRNGHVLAADYGLGQVVAFDRNYHPEPEETRSFRIGQGLSRFSTPIWDSARDRYVIAPSLGSGVGKAFALASLTAPAQPIVDLSAASVSGVSGGAYLPSRDQLAWGSGTNIFVFDAATGASSAVLTTAFQINGLGDDRSQDQYILHAQGGGRRVWFVDRAGNTTSGVTVSISPLGINVGTRGSQRLIVGRNLYDRAGNLVRIFDPAILGLSTLDALVPLTSGPYAGGFLACDAGNASECVIFF